MEGSDDGTHWFPLDHRTNQHFAWDRQTRPFSLPAPSTHRHYRLTLPHPAPLAETELLGQNGPVGASVH